MIYCIAFADFEEHIRSLGFTRAGETELTILFRRGDQFLTVRAPVGARRSLPEMIANSALENADLPVPSWTVFWCD